MCCKIQSQIYKTVGINYPSFLFIELFIIMKIIITEQQNEQLNNKIRLTVKKLGLEQSRQMFGDELIKQGFIDNPLSFLDQFNDLRRIEKYEDGFEDINYVDENNYIIFYYTPEDDRHRSLYVYYDIWSFFTTTMEYSDHNCKEIIKNWLKDVYGLIDKPIGIMVSKINITDQN